MFGVIDLHCHVLPGIDDGPGDISSSLRMAEAAVHEGIHTIVATPHVNLQYDTPSEAIAVGVANLRAALEREGVALSLVAGAEIGLTRLPGLDDDGLSALCIGGSSYALIESPYNSAGPLIEQSIFDLQVRGFRPVLAHPERCRAFQRNIARLEQLVSSGVICSINAGSVIGQFGQTARRFAHRLLERRLVHNLSSDAHDAVKRAPTLRIAFRALEGAGGSAQLERWLTASVPAAIVADEPLPPRPATQGAPRWRRRIGGR